MLCLFFTVSYAQKPAGKTVVTGDILEVLQSGEKIISKGRSKAVNDKNTVTADKMTYIRKDSVLTAAGNVKIFSKTDDGEPVEAYGSYAKYNIETGQGKVWGAKTSIKYYLKTSTAPFILKAHEIILNGNKETITAYKNVEVITSSGVIYSDNALFEKKNEAVYFNKDNKRPSADVHYDGRKGFYEADKMTFYNSDDNKKIVMSGSVAAKIEMEDKPQ
ncbi:MAG: hypothetical protein FWF00_06160 [Endomicrobia bacterium]|nr:hypothetical protein [Endomicrobiia bacterium]MCL2507250.1 hypothetical protein [Endomicrobiia bacterium]